MKIFFLHFVFLFGFALAESNQKNLVQTQRKAIVQLHFLPPDSLKLTSLDSTGKNPVVLSAVSLIAIGDELERGRSIKLFLNKKTKSDYETILAIPKGQWNLHLQAKLNNSLVYGSYLLNVKGNETRGQMSLIPQTTEPTRIGRMVALMFGLPIALGLLIVLSHLVFAKKMEAPHK